MSMAPAGTADLPIGRPFDCSFGAFVPRLTFLSAIALQLDIPAPTGMVRQVVAFEGTVVRPGMIMLSWVEDNGTVVVQLQDYGTHTVLSHARLPDGTLVRSAGIISWATH